MIHSKCIEKKTERFITGEWQKIFRVKTHNLFIGLTVGGKHAWQYCTDASGTIVYFRALLGHSGRNLTDPSLQDNSNFFQRINHVGCAFNLHSIINSGWIPKFEQDTDSILPACWSYGQKSQGSWCDWLECTASYLHKAWKRHQDAVYCVDINLAMKKGLTFCQTRSNAIILQDTFQLIVLRKLLWWKLENLGLRQRSPWNTNGKEN